MTEEQKALKACADYARLTREIASLKTALGDHLGKCPGVEPEGEPCHDDFDFAVGDTHLKIAYTPHMSSGSDYYEPTEVWNNEAQIRAYLAVCPHCLAAHEAIQARKAARRSLGAAKRQIGAIGRKAAK
jgi:hypothetical protein